MKQLLIALFLMLTLCGCSSQGQQQTFYYLAAQPEGTWPQAVISEEMRTVAGDQNLNYLLRLYLEGPASVQFVSPFPDGLRLLSTKLDADNLHVYLSAEYLDLKDVDLSLANACLSSTCFSLADVHHVQIIITTANETVYHTISRESYLFSDTP